MAEHTSAHATQPKTTQNSNISNAGYAPAPIVLPVLPAPPQIDFSEVQRASRGPVISGVSDRPMARAMKPASPVYPDLHLDRLREFIRKSNEELVIVLRDFHLDYIEQIDAQLAALAAERERAQGNAQTPHL